MKVYGALLANYGHIKSDSLGSSIIHKWFRTRSQHYCSSDASHPYRAAHKHPQSSPFALAL